MARKQRVDKGQSRFCSREHHREWLKSIGSQSTHIGKENALISLDANGFYRAYWHDPETMQYKSTTWAKWAWELNFGEIPKGYRAGYKDGNSLNNAIENLCLQSSEDFGKKLSKLSKGRVFTDKHKQAIRDGRMGMRLSDSHRVNIGNAQRKMWAEGKFDNVHKGEHNKRWRGGVPDGYPPEFYEIKDFIKERDNYTCQICGKSVYRSRHGHVHHIDGNRDHNDEENLILLCSSCHSKVHQGEGMSSPVIMAFRNMLEWNHNDMPEHNLPNPLNFPDEL